MLSHRLINRTLSCLLTNVKNAKNSYISNHLITKNPVSSFHQYSTDIRQSTNPSSPFQEVIEDTSEEDRLQSREIIKKVNDHIAQGAHGRLFAVIYLLGKQYKVTSEDLLVIENHWAPKMKDVLIFEKVLLVGGANFTLIGRPILPKNVVRVSATVVNKDLTYTKYRLYRRAKKRVCNLNFVRNELTFLRINKIDVYPNLNELTQTEYLRE